MMPFVLIGMTKRDAKKKLMEHEATRQLSVTVGTTRSVTKLCDLVYMFLYASSVALW